MYKLLSMAQWLFPFLQFVFLYDQTWLRVGWLVTAVANYLLILYWFVVFNEYILNLIVFYLLVVCILWFDIYVISEFIFE